MILPLPTWPAWGDAHYVPTVSAPVVGSVVYCEIAFGRLEHSGIYVGLGEIVSLSSDGEIVKEGPQSFLDGITTGETIFVSCNGTSPAGDPSVAKRAREMVGDSRDYNVLLNNCHQFTSECLTGSAENGDLALWMLKDTAEERLGADNWLRWEEFMAKQLPIPSTESYDLLLLAVAKAVSSVAEWAREREKRIETEARLDAEVKIQRMKTKDYAKKLETELKAFVKKLEANERYIKDQLEDRKQSRKAAKAAIKEVLQYAYRCFDSLENPNSAEMPPQLKAQVGNAIVLAINSAAKLVDKFPSGPLATLD